MKIAFIHQPFTPFVVGNKQSGSIEIWHYEMARRLAQNHRVIVYTKKGVNQRSIEDYQGVRYKHISATVFSEWFAFISRKIDRQLLRIPNFKRPLFASTLYYLIFALRVAKDLKSENCDIVHITNFSQFVPIIRALNPKIKIVLHMQCEWLTQLDRGMIGGRMKKLDLNINCSQYVTDKIRCRFPEFANHCHTLYNGVDVDAFVAEKTKAPEDGTTHVLFVGRVSPEKGVHVLIDAFIKIAKNSPQVKLHIVGPIGSLPVEWAAALSHDPKVLASLHFFQGSYGSHLKDRIPAGMTNVSFEGCVSGDELIRFYKNTDLFVFPSLWHEPFGIPVIEAMSAGVPVVATASGGIPEIVKDGETGLLVERGDTSALADAILRVLSDVEFARSMAQTARRRVVELFSWDHLAQNLQRMYEHICYSDSENLQKTISGFVRKPAQQ
jgi:glycosyltransferase involved in cell wall biosynthesis